MNREEGKGKKEIPDTEAFGIFIIVGSFGSSVGMAPPKGKGGSWAEITAGFLPRGDCPKGDCWAGDRAPAGG